MASHVPPRIEGETVSAYAAFTDYCLMGTGRSIRRLADVYRSAKKAPPSRRYRTLIQWSSANQWQERVAVYDQSVANSATETAVDAQTAWIARETAAANLLMDAVEKRLADYAELGWRGLKPHDLQALLKALNEVSVIGRRAHAMPDKYTHSTIEADVTGEIKLYGEWSPDDWDE